MSKKTAASFPQKNKVFIYGFFLLLIAAIVSLSLGFKCQQYSCLSLPDSSLLELVEEYDESKDYWSGLLSHPEYSVRLEVRSSVDDEEAKYLTEKKLTQILSLYDSASSPYPGVISHEIGCAEENKPQQFEINNKNNLKIDYINSYLNSRLRYGSCLEDEWSSQVTGAMLYCRDSSQWYFIEFIRDLTQQELDFSSIIDEIGCQRPSKIGKISP